MVRPERVEPVDGAGPAGDPSGNGAETLTKQDFEALARFRFGIRRYLRFSEETVRSAGVTPQQYQLMLAIKGFPGRDWALVRELAERLQLRHHSVVELVTRAQREGLVERAPDPDDARAVRVLLSRQGERVLGRLSALHREELRRMDAALALPRWHTTDPLRPAHHPTVREAGTP
jgi:DNA-binding MarR family transcriptional regulator